MRITGAILLLIAGIWSVIGGSCTTFAGGVAAGGAEIVGRLAQANESAGGGADPEAMNRVMRASGTAREVGGGMKLAGAVIFAGGVLCVIAAVFFFLDRARLLGMIAAGVGIIGEGLFLSLAFFNWPGVVKIGLLLFALVSAGWVGRAAAANPAGPVAGDRPNH